MDPQAPCCHQFKVTLVHGTFGSDSAWLSPTSPVRTALAGIPGFVSDDIFTWSGRNSHSGRVQAGRDLAAYLKKLDDQKVKRFIIAHSHGGNVALYAIRDPEAAQRVAGLIFFATPFISIENAPLQTLTARLAPWLVEIACITGLFIFLGNSGISKDALGLGLLVSLCAYPFFLGLRADIKARRRQAAVAALGGAKSSPEIMQRYIPEGERAWTRTLQDLLQPASCPAETTLILRHKGDEATAALALSSASSLVLRKCAAILNWILTAPYAGAASRFQLGERTSLAAMLLLALLAILSFSYVLGWQSEIEQPPALTSSWWRALGLSLATLTAFLWIAVVLTTFIILSLLTLTQFMLGLDGGLWSRWVVVRANARPSPEHHVCEVRPDQPAFSVGGLLNLLVHCRIMASPEAIRHMSSWIQRQCATQN